MVITFETVEAIIEDLREEAQEGRIFENTIRVRVDEIAEDDEGAVFSIGLWVTALIQDLDGDQWILEFGGLAGKDDRTEAQDLEGTEQATAWRALVEALAEDCDLRIRGGKIEVIG